MSTHGRSRSVLPLVTCVAIVLAFQAVWCAAPRAEEKKSSCTLAFGLPEGTLLHYKDFAQTGQNYGGTDVSMNQTSEVDMSYAGEPDSTGNARVSLKFIKIKSSLVMGGQLQEWESPIKLEGADIRVFVSRAGKVVRFEPGRNIPGLRNVNDLRDAVDTWFVDLPDSTVAIGESWKREIVEGMKEGQEPEIKGEVVYTLKKIETRGNIEIAAVEGKGVLKMNSETPAGTLVADGKVDVKAQIAVPGGYIVELKQTVEIRGNTVAKDPLTDKETKRATAVTRYTEITLQK